MRHIAWSALLIVLMLGATPTGAFAQSYVCQAIRHGESATQAARRVTGHGQDAYQPWFQIMNPSSRFVPKSQYSRIRAGWRACVVKTAIRRVVVSPAHVGKPDIDEGVLAPHGSVVSTALASSAPLAREDAASRPHPAASPVLRRPAALNLTILWLCAAMAVPLFGWRIVDDYLARKRTASFVVQQFAQRFVDEFERPLIRDDVRERPLQSRLRFRLRRGRFDILLAPGDGRRYPNLSDHKKNVEYDISRVMHLLGDDGFASGAPYTQASWIVVPFQFTDDSKPSGVTCISSL